MKFIIHVFIVRQCVSLRVIIVACYWFCGTIWFLHFLAYQNVWSFFSLSHSVHCLLVCMRDLVLGGGLTFSTFWMWMEIDMNGSFFFFIWLDQKHIFGFYEFSMIFLVRADPVGGIRQMWTRCGVGWVNNVLVEDFLLSLWIRNWQLLTWVVLHFWMNVIWVSIPNDWQLIKRN